MPFEKIGGGFERKESYHNAVFASGKIWLFSRANVEQKTFNWGKRVSHTGGYAVAFDVAAKSWGAPIEFPAVKEDENMDEVLFEAGGSVYMLLYVNFCETAQFYSLHKWNGQKFEQTADLGGKAPSQADSSVSVELVVADSDSSTEKYIVANTFHGIKVHKLSISGGTVEQFSEISADVNTLRGKAKRAAVVGSTLIVSFGTHGCGFRWEGGRFFHIDLNDKQAKVVDMGLDFGDLPKYCFGGPYVSAQRGSSWFFFGGAIQVGMSDSKFTGECWELQNAAGSPAWKKLDYTAQAGEGDDFLGAYDAASGTVYTVGVEGVQAVQI